MCRYSGSTTPIQLNSPGVQNLVAYAYSGTTYPTVSGTTVTWYSSSGTLRVEYDVTCGHVVQTLNFTNTCGSSGTYTLSPNPASREFTISEKETKAEGKTASCNR